MVSNSIIRKKIKSTYAESVADATPSKLGPTIPQGMKLYVLGFRPTSTGAATTLNVYSGISTDKKQTNLRVSLPCLVNTAAGYNDSWEKGDIDEPVMVVEPGLVAGVRSNTELYIGDGGVRVACYMDYYLDY